MEVVYVLDNLTGYILKMYVIEATLCISDALQVATQNALLRAMGFTWSFLYKRSV